jgi:hypothetical protein
VLWGHWLSDVSKHWNHLEAIEMQIARLHPQTFSFTRFEAELRVCISRKFSGGAAGPGTALRTPIEKSARP